MSGLYSGITFSKAGSDSASPAPAPATSNGPQSTATTAEQREIERQRESALEDAARYAAQQAEQHAKEQAETARKAALGFQPVMRKRPQAGKARPLVSGAVISAGPSTISAASTISAPPSLINEMNSGSSSSVLSAPPMDLKEASSSKPSSSGRTLPPPSMTLEDEDVNGFRSTKAGKKAGSKKKKRNAGLNRKDEDPSLAWTAEYDPSRPTDYAEYKAYSKRARTERRAALLRERQMEKRKQGMQSEGSDYSEDAYSDEEQDSDEERRKRIAKANSRFFAPPTNYDDNASPTAMPSTSAEAESSKRGVQDDGAMAEEQPYKPSAPPADDGWSSWSSAPAKTVDPFQQRLALSQPQPFLSSQPPVRLDPVQRQPSPLSFSASSGAPSSFAQPPTFVNATATANSAPSPSVNPSIGQPFPLPPHMMSSMPSSGSQSPQAFVPSSMTPSAGPANADSQGPKVPVAIEEAQARARAIAARLASLGKLGAKPSPSNEQAQSASSMSPLSMPAVPSANEPIPGLGGPSPAPQQAPRDNVKPEDFAKTLMAKYGWTKGQGLGATSQGMVNPLSLAGSDGQASSSKSKSKKEQQQFQAQGQPKGGPVGIATSVGRIVSDIKTEKEQMERQKYGEPTRVVCLTNMVGRDEVDDELVADVSEEARKLGVLEKCFVHLQPPYVPEDEAVRVFVVFSGLVGAWNAVKAFDGRYFGGRNVKAKFYNEQALDLGVLHL